MSKNMNFSADYTLIKHALRDERDSFKKIIEEMKSFKGEPVEEKEEKIRKSWTLHLQKYNKTLPIDFIEKQAKAFSSYNHQLRQAFGNRLEAHKAKIILLSSALIEAYINFYLSLKAAEKFPNLYSDLENMRAKNKWLYLPKIFNNEYEFDKEEHIYTVFCDLIKRRNYYAHYKTEVIIDNKIVIKGKKRPLQTKDETLRLLEFCDLPNLLLDLLLKYEKDSTVIIQISFLKKDFEKPIY